jgi:hypothetical protein
MTMAVMRLCHRQVMSALHNNQHVKIGGRMIRGMAMADNNSGR